MATNSDSFAPDVSQALRDIQSTLQSIQSDFRQLSSTVEAVDGKVNVAASINEIKRAQGANESTTEAYANTEAVPPRASLSLSDSLDDAHTAAAERISPLPVRNVSTPSRIILTTYPGQSGIGRCL